MPNLGKLKTILSFDDEYDEKAKINVIRGTRDDPNALSSIHFETGSGDFVNDYRFTAQSFIEDKVRAVTYHGTGWDIEIQPSVASILRLKKQQSANSEETKFRTMVEDDNLKVYFGDPSSHNGNFVFASNITGKINDKFLWPIAQVLNILNLTGDKTLRLSNKGAMEITVDSGLCDYRYLLPAQQK
jgi:hypothetical protein